MMHRQLLLNSAPPRLDTVRRWALNHIASPYPGLYWTVSYDFGLIVIDYSLGEFEGIFRSLSSQYFAFVRQLTWTNTLSPALRAQKRYEAILEFVARNRM